MNHVGQLWLKYTTYYEPISPFDLINPPRTAVWVEECSGGEVKEWWRRGGGVALALALALAIAMAVAGGIAAALDIGPSPSPSLAPSLRL